MEKGFTLLEVLVVLAVVSIFAAIIGSVVGTSIISAEIEASDLRLDNLKEALLSYFDDTDEFPADTGNSESDLQSLVTDPGAAGWDGPYISSGFESNDFVKDAWMRTIIYSYTSGDFSCTIRSSGPDGTANNSDDIVLTVDATSGYRAKTDRVRDELEVVKAAAQAYASDHGGTYPGSIGDLFADDYLSDESYRRDIWATNYQVSGNQFISYGPDQSPGGGDDVYPY
jgi:general secretion pathway protein G